MDTAMLTEVILHGSLAEEFGNVFKIEIANAAEAIRNLCANFPNFKKRIRQGNWQLIREGKNVAFDLDEKTLALGIGGGKLHIVPALQGAGSNGGTAKIIIGVALIAASILIPGMAGFAISEGFGMMVGSTAISYGALGLAGLGLALGGLSMMIAPGLSHDAANKGSTQVGGGIGAVQEGDGVQLVFGRMMVTPRPVATQIVTAQVDVGNNNFQYSGSLSPTYIGNNGDFINHYN